MLTLPHSGCSAGNPQGGLGGVILAESGRDVLALRAVGSDVGGGGGAGSLITDRMSCFHDSDGDSRVSGWGDCLAMAASPCGPSVGSSLRPPSQLLHRESLREQTLDGPVRRMQDRGHYRANGQQAAGVCKNVLLFHQGNNRRAEQRGIRRPFDYNRSTTGAIGAGCTSATSISRSSRRRR